MKMNFKKSIYYFGFCALTMAIIIPFNIASAGRQLGKQRKNRYHSWSEAETNRLLDIMLNYSRGHKSLFGTKGATKRFPTEFWDKILDEVKKDEIFSKNDIRRISISTHFYNIFRKAKISNGIDRFREIVFNDNITKISYDGENINYNNGDESKITNDPKVINHHGEAKNDDPTKKQYEFTSVDEGKSKITNESEVINHHEEAKNNGSPKKPHEFTNEDCDLLCNNILKLLENPGEINIIDIIIRKDYTSSQ